MTRSERTSRALVALTCALVTFRPFVASADAHDEAAARALFSEGRKLVDAGEYAEACPKFEESLRLDPGAGTKFNLADCLEHLGRTASAWARFLDVAATTKAAGQTEREQVARARAAALEPHLSRLLLQVSTPAPGLTLERDGVDVGKAAWGVAIPVDPGEHQLRASAPATEPWAQTVLVPNAPTTVTVSVPALEALPEAVATPSPASARRASPAPTVNPDRPTRWSVPVVVLGSFGVAALTTSLVLALEVHSKNDEAKGLCPNSSCMSQDEKTRHDDLVAEATRARTFAYVSAGVGGAALLAAAYLFWQPFRSSSEKARTKTGSLRPLLGPFSAGLEAAW